jgi:hypothetical protein
LRDQARDLQAEAARIRAVIKRRRSARRSQS